MNTVPVEHNGAPSSGMLRRNRLENVALLTKRDEVKFVCGSLEDNAWMRQIVLECDLPARAGAVLVSPVFGAFEPLALHKLIWEPDLRGV